MNKSITILYFTNYTDSVGIENKMHSFYNSAKKNSTKVNLLKINTNGYFKDFIQLFNLIKFLNDIVIIRYNNSRNIHIFLLEIILKFKKKTIILDIPTPIINSLQELKISNSNNYSKLILLIITKILGPIPFLFSDLVLQYSSESRYYNPTKVKSLLVGNGIDTSEVFSRINKDFIFNINTDCINLVSIGTLAPWHGWDKVLYALANIKNNNNVFNLKYYIIGDGVELKNLTILCNKLDLQDYVFFLGPKKREDYVNIINRCNLGVGSLAWERVGVKVASPLKNREYISCGIPVVYNAFDIDISKSGFGFEINSDLESIQTFFNWFIDFNDPKDKTDYYNFAKEKLDMDIKFKSILMNL